MQWLCSGHLLAPACVLHHACCARTGATSVHRQALRQKRACLRGKHTVVAQAFAPAAPFPVAMGKKLLADLDTPANMEAAPVRDVEVKAATSLLQPVLLEI